MYDDLPDLGARKKLAKTLAQKLVKDVGIKIAPVSLQQVIEFLQTKYDLDVRRIEASEKVSGLLVVCTSLDGEYSTIGFNGSHPWCRRRFTIAHEIGHLLLEHTCNGREEGTHNEQEANIFAAELLMPASAIKKDFKITPNIEDLSKLYRVSAESLSIRLMDARLV